MRNKWKSSLIMIVVHSLMMVLYIHFYSFSIDRNFGRNALRMQHEERNCSIRGGDRIVVSTLCCSHGTGRICDQTNICSVSLAHTRLDEF